MTTPTLLEAARALAMAREAYRFLLDAQPDTTERAIAHGADKYRAKLELDAAEAALDAAYRREEYGDES